MYLKSGRTWLFLSYIFMVLYLSGKPGDELSWFSELWKYDKIVTPTIEYERALSHALGPTLRDKCITFFDDQGQLIILRPE